MNGYLASYRVSPRLAFRVWQREMTLYKRIWPSTILSTMFDPVIYLLAMGLGFGATVGSEFGGVPYRQFLAPGLLASAVMMGAVYECAWNSFVRINIERSYEAMMATPATLEDVVGGELLWAVTRAIVNSAIMLGVILAFGLVRSPWALLVPALAVLGGAAFAGIGLAYTTRIRHMDHLTFYFTLFVTPLYLFSGVFFPVDRLPPPAATLAQLSPLYHLAEAMRDLVLGTVDATTLLHAAVLAAVALVAFGLPAASLRRRLLA